MSKVGQATASTRFQSVMHWEAVIQSLTVIRIQGATSILKKEADETGREIVREFVMAVGGLLV